MISIVTPLLNEEDYVKPFLNHLQQLEGDFELILVDGGSTDKTLEEVESNISKFSRRISLLKTPHGRAAQMNEGARKAQGSILLFLHVDCFVPKDAPKLIEGAIPDRMTAGGAFKQAFLTSDAFLNVVSLFGNLRSELTRTFFGDYGIFIRKDLFQEIGGYGNLPFLEDVEICRRAKKYGKLVQIDHYVFTSPRRYLSIGKIKLTAMFILAYLLSFVGFRPGFFTSYIVNK